MKNGKDNPIPSRRELRRWEQAAKKAQTTGRVVVREINGTLLQFWVDADGVFHTARF